jgi:uncharacterized protein (TIGR03435 family)
MRLGASAHYLPHVPPRGYVTLVVKTAVLLLFLVCAALAQAPSFEVASVKKAAPPARGGSSPTAGRIMASFHRTGCSGGPGTHDPGMYTCDNATIARMAIQAYSLQAWQMTGADDDTDRYTVRARIPTGATAAEVKLMLRELLVERFHLRFHYEKKLVEVYDLSVAKSGLKMRETAAESGRQTESRENGIEHLAATAVGIGSLISTLTNLLKAPVLDTTGLTGRYDFSLAFALESLPGGGSVSDPEPGLTLFAALEKQIGLSLERKKQQVDIFVIDHVDKSAAEN